MADRSFKSQNQRNTEYYQQVFYRLDKENKTTFNWAAALFGASWMVFRKMYGWAILCSCLNSLFLLLTFTSISNRAPPIVCVIFQLALILCFGFFGNIIYYKEVKSKVAKGYNKIENYNAIAPIQPFIFIVVRCVLLASFLYNLLSFNQTPLLICIVFEPIMIAVFWAIDYKKCHKLESVGQEEVDEESILHYLNKANLAYLGTALESLFGFFFVLFLTCWVCFMLMGFFFIAALAGGPAY